MWSATTAVVAYTRYCRFAIKIVRLAFQLVSISAHTWSSFWHFASPHSAAAAPLCQIFTMRSFFYTFFSFLLRKFSHALVSFFCFSSFPLTSWHCHLHLRITHARNNKIYLFSLFPSACLTFHRLSLFFSLRLTTVTNELWLVLLDALTLSYSRLLACRKKNINISEVLVKISDCLTVVSRHQHERTSVSFFVWVSRCFTCKSGIARVEFLITLKIIQ